MHTIRLRRPWLRTDGEDGQAVTVGVPDDKALVDAPRNAANTSIVRYERSFHRPTGLEDAERVWLTIDSCSGGPIRVLLNGSLLADGVTELPLRLPVKPVLEPTNRLTIEIESSSPSPGRIDGEVTLQIG